MLNAPALGRAPGTEAEFRRILSAPPGEAAPVGYWINRRFMFMGKWLRHAYYPNWNLRLFRHRLGRHGPGRPLRDAGVRGQ